MVLPGYLDWKSIYPDLSALTLGKWAESLVQIHEFVNRDAMSFNMFAVPIWINRCQFGYHKQETESGRDDLSVKSLSQCSVSRGLPVKCFPVFSQVKAVSDITWLCPTGKGRLLR